MSEKILYIEDNEANRMLIRFILEPHGYELTFDRLERSLLYEIIPLDLSGLSGPQPLFYNEQTTEDRLL